MGSACSSVGPLPFYPSYVEAVPLTAGPVRRGCIPTFHDNHLNVPEGLTVLIQLFLSISTQY